MDINSILGSDGYHIKNPEYKPGNGKPEYIVTDDPSYAPRTTADIFMQASQQGDLGSLGEASAYKRYIRGGITPSRVDDIANYDVILANNQSRGEKWKNALAQTVVNELLLGTVKSFTDLADIISGQVFRSDNDYANPASRYLEELQNSFKENHEIYTDPNKTLGHGALFDVGWWASNVPSIASTITLLIPSKAVLGGIKLATKGIKAGVSLSRKGALAIKKLERAHKLGRNTEKGIRTRRMFENGVSALTMRTLENYQEGRQVYDDMYQQASESLNHMSAEEYQDFLNKNANNISDSIDLNDRDAVARDMAHDAATKTFITDYTNIIFDVIQLNALRNPLKYEKNMRRTAAVNKTQRERIAATLKAAGIESGKGSEKSLLRNVGNWFKDHSTAYLAVAGELGEGVEEAINYIAQEEGMHYGNVMLGLDDKNSLGDRLASYLTSSDLYESAFWGVLGGVGFQSAGSGINRLSNRIQGDIKERKENKEGKKTKEKNNTNWKAKYETSEDKYRTEQMAKPVKDLTTLKERLAAIKNNKDPFRDNADFTSEQEKEEARDRAIKEYTTAVAFSAIDSGTWDLTKDYLRDENIQKALREIGAIDDESGDIENIIAQMDKVEQDYNDELQRVSELTTYFSDMPFEYIQIIARDNTKAKQKIDRLDELIKQYETSADRHWDLLKQNLDASIDYKHAVELAVAASRIGELNALKKEINSDKKLRESVDGQLQLNEINKKLNVIYNSVLSNIPKTVSETGEQVDDTTRQLSELMYVIGHASQIEHSKQGGYTINSTSDEYLDFLGDITTGSIGDILKRNKESLGRDFEVTDEQILKVFGDIKNGDKNGQYHHLKHIMDNAFHEKNGLQNKQKELFEDYSRLAYLNLARAENLASMATTTKSVDLAIHRTHNWVNQARAAAIKQSWDTIDELSKTYGYDTMYSAIFTNNKSSKISESDNRKLAYALEVLNLTAEHNSELAAEIRRNLMLSMIEQEVQQAKAKKEAKDNGSDDSGEFSSKSKKQPTETKPKSPIDNPQPIPKSPTLNETGQNGQPSPLNDDNKTTPQKLVISFDADGNINATTVDETDEAFGFYYKVMDNGEVNVYAKKTLEEKQIPDRLSANTTLFDGYDANNKGKIEILKSPILAKDDNENWYVKEKGIIRYKPKESKAPISATGGVESTPTSTSTTSYEGELIDKQYEENEKEQNRFISEVKPEIRKISESIKDGDTEESVVAKINELKEKYKGKYNITEKQYDSTFNSWLRTILRNNKSKLHKAIGNVMLSTITEENGEFKFGEDYIKAVDTMIETYANEYGIGKIDDKYYINVEDLLRRVNYLYQDKGMAAVMYGAMIAYMQTTEGKQKYTITDSNVNSILENSIKDVKERRNELIGSKTDIRVAIDDLFLTNDEKFRKAYATLREGDILKFSLEDSSIQLKKNNTVIGRLPLPKINEKTGNYYQEHMGWIEEVEYNGTDEEGNTIASSNLSEFYNTLLLHEDELSTKLYNNITKLNYDNLSKTERTNLIEETHKLIQELATNIYGDSDKILNNKKPAREIVLHLANVIKYFNGTVEAGTEKLWIRSSVNEWFGKLFDSYNEIDSLKNNLDSDNVTIQVSKMTPGELIRNMYTDASTGISNENYDKMRQSNDPKCLGKDTDACIGFINPKDANELITTEKTIPLTNQMPYRSSGKMYVIIKKPNRDTKGNYEPENADFVSATSVRANDDKINKRSACYQTFKAVKNELNYLIDEYAKDPSDANFDKLNNFVKLVFSDKNNIPLFWNVRSNNYDDKLYINFGKTHIQINKGILKTDTDDNLQEVKTVNYFGIGRTNEEKKTSYKYLDNSKESIKELKDVLNKIFDYAAFNLDEQYFRGTKSNGIITFDDKGTGLTIHVPDSKTGKDVNKHYKSFNELVLKGGFIRVNTSVNEDGSNYNHKGENQAANQTLRVSINYKTKPPVKESMDKATKPEISTKQTIKSVFKDNVASIDDILKDSGFPEETINLLKSLDLLPKSIIFAEELNNEKTEGKNGIYKWNGPNARSVINKGETLVGNKWIDMYDGEGEFIYGNKQESRKQAIRKLIHEQIHHKLHSDDAKLREKLDKVKEVFDEFNKYLDDNKVPRADSIRQYLFKQYGDDTDRILEEFLVESLTSKALGNYLNKIPTQENKKVSLFEKLVNFIKDILGINVESGSLLEKQLNNIQEFFGATTPIADDVTEEVKQKPVKEEKHAKPRRSRSTKIEDAEDLNRESTIVEDNNVKPTVYPSFNSFVNTTDNPAEIIRAAQNGELNITCK